MGAKITAFLGAAGIVLSSAWLAGQKPPLAPKFKAWIEDEVNYIVTAREREVFLKLATDEDRDGFIEEFWRQRDPTPGTPRNEFREEHTRRIAFADKTFGRGIPFRGSKTDQGRIYVILGAPMNVEKFESPEIYPCEVWYYQGKPRLGQATFFRLLFFKRGGGYYDLYNPAADNPRDLLTNTALYADRQVTVKRQADEIVKEIETLPEEALLPLSWDPLEKQAWIMIHDRVSPDLAATTISFYPGKRDATMILASSMLLGEIEKYPQKAVKDDYALDILAHKPTVEVSYSVNAIGNKSAVGVYQDPTGVFFAHYVLVPDSITIDAFEDRFFADLRTTLRLADPQGRTLFQQEKSIPIDMQKDELRAVESNSFQLYDAFPVIPGTHTLHLLFENTISKEFTTIERRIMVPEAGEFQMSPILLARKAFKVAPAPGGPSRAFQIGAYQLYPSVNNQFPEKERVFLFFQLYGLPRAILDGGQVEAAISQDGKVAQTVRRPVRDFEDGRNVLIELPTDRVPAGSYVLHAGVSDPNGREVMAAETAFQMTTRGAPGAWVVARTNPPAYDPFYAYVLGTQYLNSGNVQMARPYLDKAHANDARNLDYGVGYARFLLLQNESAKAREILLRFVGPEGGNFALYEALGQAAQNIGETKEAVTWYERALTFRGNFADVLNPLGDCHFALGNKDQALKAWTRSIEISPDQEAIKKKLADLKR